MMLSTGLYLLRITKMHSTLDIHCKTLTPNQKEKSTCTMFRPFSRAELVVPFCIASHCLDNPRVQEEENQDW